MKNYMKTMKKLKTILKRPIFSALPMPMPAQQRSSLPLKSKAVADGSTTGSPSLAQRKRSPSIADLGGEGNGDYGRIIVFSSDEGHWPVGEGCGTGRTALWTHQIRCPHNGTRQSNGMSKKLYKNKNISFRLPKQPNGTPNGCGFAFHSCLAPSSFGAFLVCLRSFSAKRKLFPYK